MRRSVATVFLATLLFAAGVLLLVQYWPGTLDEARGDVAEDGLRGRVAEVVVESAPFVERFGEWVEAARQIESVTRYDEWGRTVEVSRYLPAGTVDYRIVYDYLGDLLLSETSFDGRGRTLYQWSYAYDDAGNVTSLSGYAADGSLDFKLVSNYGDDGRLIREVSFDADERMNFESHYTWEPGGALRETSYYTPGGVADYRTVERLDGQGNRVEEAGYEPEGELLYRVEYDYDPQGRLTEERAFDGDDQLQYHLMNRYDRQGNVVETSEYSADGSLFYRYLYEYDDYGNVTARKSVGEDDQTVFRFRYSYEFDESGSWTKRVTERWTARFGEERYEPLSVSYREVTYH